MRVIVMVQTEKYILDSGRKDILDNLVKGSEALQAKPGYVLIKMK